MANSDTSLPHSDATLLNRRRAVSVMLESGVDAIVATSPENVAYLTGYVCQTHWLNKGTPVFAVMTPNGSDGPWVIAPALEMDAWAEIPPPAGQFLPSGTSAWRIGRELGVEVADLAPVDRWIFDHGFGDKDHPTAEAALGSLLHELQLGGTRLALDETGLRYRDRERAMGSISAEWIDGGSVLRRMRTVKSDTELHRLGEASRIASEALESTIEIAKPGVTEYELLRHYNAAVADRGALPSFASINAGTRSAHPHSVASDYALQAGDVVKYDVGCTYGFYHSDIARTQVIGRPSDEQRRTYEALLAGEQAGIAALRPGATPSDVYLAALDAAHAAGLPGYRRHHVGHGIGIEVYDPPLIQPRESSSELSGLGSTDMLIEVGMVINIETPYYLLGKFGMTVEDTLVVEEGGVRYLTQLDRGIF